MPTATLAANTRHNSPSKIASTPHRKNAAQAKPAVSQQPDCGSERDNPVQQLIKQAVDSLVQQLEAGKSDALIAYLAAMARFHRYSFGNILAIARQCPTATRVAGYQTWKELGRQVMKGENGIQIFAPMVVKRRRRDTDELDREANPQSVIIGFRPVYVWERLSRDLGSEILSARYIADAPRHPRWQNPCPSIQKNRSVILTEIAVLGA